MKKNPSFALSEDGGELFICGQNTPWEEVLHLGARTILAKGAMMQSGNYDQFYYVRRGCIRLERLCRSGDDCIVLYLMHGAFFNEAVCIIQPMTSRDCCDISFTAIEETELYAFKGDLPANRDFIVRYPHLIYNLLQSVAYKSRLFLLSDSNGKLLSPLARVCRTLLKMWTENGPLITQTEMSKALGVPRSTLCRILAKLREDKIVGAFTKKKLIILNEERLRELAAP